MVLDQIAKWTDWERLKANQSKTQTLPAVQFIAEGQYRSTKEAVYQRTISILSTATDWELQVDFKKKLVFPSEVAVMTLSPDMLLVSRKTKSMYIVKLTIPWKDRLDTAHQIACQV